MSWKDALGGIEEFSQKKEEKESHISQDRSRVAIEPKSDESLLAKFSPMVKEVYKYFASKTGSRYQDEKVGSSEISSIFEIASPEGADDFKLVNVFPVVHMTAWGILVEVPLRSEGAARRCREIIDKWEGREEGYYTYHHQDKLGGWIDTKSYFIPYEHFTQLKLARIIAELYREGMRNYLEELHG